VETLDAEGDPVDARLHPGTGALRGHVIGIGLEGDLGIISHCPTRPDAIEDGRQRLWRQAARGSAAEVHRFDTRRLSPTCGILPACPLVQCGLGERGRRHLTPDRDGKIAVAASAGAERDMDIDQHAES
jgi:hypothetical protein